MKHRVAELRLEDVPEVVNSLKVHLAG